MRELHTLVPRVHPPGSLTGPEPSGSPGPSRRCRGGFSPIGSQIASSAAGTGLLLLGAAGIALAAVGVLREQGTAVGLGAVTSYTGALMLQTPVNHIAELAVTAALFTLFALWRSAARVPGSALVFGVLAATIAVPRLVWELTDGEVSAAGVLLVAGAVLLIASAIGIRLRHRAAAKPARVRRSTPFRRRRPSARP